MKRLVLLVIMAGLCVLPLVGCAGSKVADSLIRLPSGEIVSAATDRWGSWERVRASEEGTKVKALEAEIKRAEADMAMAESKAAVNINISTNEELLTYALHTANERLAQSNQTLGRIALALASGGSPYDNLVSATPMPRGAFAEFADSMWGGAKGVLDTPAAGIAAGGYFVKEIVKASTAGAGHEFNLAEGDLNASGAFNRTEVNQFSTTESTLGVTEQPYTVEPRVVTPPDMVVQ